MKATCVDGDYIKWCNMIGHIYMGMYSRCLYCVKTHVQLNASNRNGNKFLAILYERAMCTKIWQSKYDPMHSNRNAWQNIIIKSCSAYSGWQKPPLRIVYHLSTHLIYIVPHGEWRLMLPNFDILPLLLSMWAEPLKWNISYIQMYVTRCEKTTICN